MLTLLRKPLDKGQPTGRDYKDVPCSVAPFKAVFGIRIENILLNREDTSPAQLTHQKTGK
jgi:hypothetical protein